MGRRQFLASAGAVLAAVGLLGKARSPARAAGVFTPAERATLEAALARIVPAESPGDWSAADVGAGDYIEKLLSADGNIYPGGPTRATFPFFRPLSRAKELGWGSEIARLREVYAAGLAELDRRAGGDFTAVPAPVQDEILTTMDLEGTAFFRALHAHTMEGVYAHPVYGGNKEYRAWKDLCYQGDVHGVRHPGGPGEPWFEHGGYSPEEMGQPGVCPGQGPEE